MEKDITPRNMILFLAVLFSFGSYFVLDRYYKMRARDVVLTMVHSSGEYLKSNNFNHFGSTVKFVMSQEPFIRSVLIFDKSFRKILHFGDEVDLSDNLYRLNFKDKVQIFSRGILKCEVKYIFGSENILLANLEDDYRFYTLFILIASVLLFFGLIYVIYLKLDLDDLNSKAAEYALELMTCGFHEMKQIVEMFRLFQVQLCSGDVYFKNKGSASVYTEDFNKNMITVESMMSILKLTNKNKYKFSYDSIDLGEVISSCLDAYKIVGKSVDCKFYHKSQLYITRDVLYATIGNLIKNAFAYSDGLVWVRTRETKRCVVFTIANTGGEIPEDRQKSILKPGITLKGQTGMGLHICNMWCQKINAQLSLQSNHAATQFTIKFPIIYDDSSTNDFEDDSMRFLGDNTELSSIDREDFLYNLDSQDKVSKNNVGVVSGEIEQSKDRILYVAVIDDVETFRLSLCDQIRAVGCVAEPFENMDLFLDKIKDNPSSFDCILIDRHGDGFDAVRDRFPDSCWYYGYRGKIILYSSDIPGADEKFLCSSGFDYVLKKGSPVDWRKYLDHI